MSYPPPPSSPYPPPQGAWPPGAMPPGMPPGSPPPPQPRPKPQYSRFTALVLSFFSAALYRDVARRWRGIGLLYLLLLMFVTWLPVVIRWNLQMRAWSDGGAAQRRLAVFPTITITSGVVSYAVA